MPLGRGANWALAINGPVQEPALVFVTWDGRRWIQYRLALMAMRRRWIQYRLIPARWGGAGSDTGSFGRAIPGVGSNAGRGACLR